MDSQTIVNRTKFVPTMYQYQNNSRLAYLMLCLVLRSPNNPLPSLLSIFQGNAVHNASPLLKTQCYAIYRYHHKKLRISQTYNKRLREPVWSLVIIAWSGYQKTFRCASFCQFPVNKHKIAPDHGCKK